MLTTLNNKHRWLTNFCESLRIFVSIFMIQLVVIIYSFNFISFDMEYLRKLSILTLLTQLVGIILLICMCKLNNFFNRFSVAPGFTLLILLVVLITSLLAQVVGYLDMRLTFDLFENISAINYLNIKLSISAVLLCFALVRYFYIQDQWQLQIQKHSDARLNALQARIKPHFLFNSLNSITALIGIDAKKAELAITDFASLMRQAFTHKDKEITLSEEINWVKQYISIEELRMGDRLKFKINCDSDLLSHKIPVLCLQPIVENAVIHGIALLENGGTIKVDIFKDDGNLVIKVLNPYIESNTTCSNGTALKNIEERLGLLYDNKGHLEIIKDTGFYTILMRLPL